MRIADISYSKEEKNKTSKQNQICHQRTENPLPVKRTRAKTHAVDYAGTHGPNQQQTMPDFQLTGFGSKTGRIPENAASQQ